MTSDDISPSDILLLEANPYLQRKALLEEQKQKDIERKV
jgi:hypothetical protein